MLSSIDYVHSLQSTELMKVKVNIILEVQTLIGKMIKSIEFNMCYIAESFFWNLRF